MGDNRHEACTGAREALGVLVTTQEHLGLGASNAWGWRRYIEAGLEVVDGESGDVLDLTQANAELRATYEELNGL